MEKNNSIIAFKLLGKCSLCRWHLVSCDGKSEYDYKPEDVKCFVEAKPFEKCDT